MANCVVFRVPRSAHVPAGKNIFKARVTVLIWKFGRALKNNHSHVPIGSFKANTVADTNKEKGKKYGKLEPEFISHDRGIVNC